jgi:hypothetical protein
MTTPKLARRWGVATAVGLLFACGGRNASPPASPEAPGFDELAVTLAVENRNFNDATVYAFDGGVRQRVGRVTGKTNATFTFKWFSPQLQMIIDFTGGGTLASERLILNPGRGGDLQLTIGPAETSRATLRPRT